MKLSNRVSGPETVRVWPKVAVFGPSPNEPTIKAPSHEDNVSINGTAVVVPGIAISVSAARTPPLAVKFRNMGAPPSRFAELEVQFALRLVKPRPSRPRPSSPRVPGSAIKNRAPP